MSRSGAELALLLLGGFRALVDDAVQELAPRGYEDVRPVHDFAMRAIAAGADNASELGRRLSVSKQAAAKTVAVLQERGFVARGADPLDARRKRLQVTPLGFEVMRVGEAIFDELREKWKRRSAPSGSSDLSLTSQLWSVHRRCASKHPAGSPTASRGPPSLEESGLEPMYLPTLRCWRSGLQRFEPTVSGVLVVTSETVRRSLLRCMAS